MVLEGLEPCEYTTLLTKTSIRLLFFENYLRARPVATLPRLVVHMRHATPVSSLRGARVDEL
jgi:hypothetical protein